MTNTVMHLIIFLFWLFVPPILFWLLLDQKSAFYLSLISISVGSVIHSLYLIYFRELKKDKKDWSLYKWLDNKNGNDITKEILGIDYNTKGETLDLLEVTQKKVLFYVENDINKLRLLKGYLKSKNKDNTTNLFVGVFLPILGALIISSFAQDHFIGRLVFSSSNELDFLVNDVIALIKYVTMLFYILILIWIALFEIHKGKRRNILMEEIIDVCIKKLNN